MGLSFVSLVLVALALPHGIPGIAGSSVVDYLLALVSGPFGLFIEPAAGAEMLVDGVVGTGFYGSVSLLMGWFLHRIIVWALGSSAGVPVPGARDKGS